MAKGDHQRLEDQINYQRPRMESNQDQMMGTLRGSQAQFQTNYNSGVGRNLNDYDNMMGKYNDIYNDPWGGIGGGGGGGGVGTGAGSAYDMYNNLAMNGGGYGWDPLARGAATRAIGGFGEFADTGGFSEQDNQDIRARDIAPTRAVFSRAMDEAKRQGRLQPFSPNMNSALSRMARDTSIAVGDMNTNANAGIAQMVQQGRLSGLQGLGQTGLGVQGASTNIDQLNAQMRLAGLGGMSSIDSANASRGAAHDEAALRARFGALEGMNNLYGTNPALASTFGNQLLTSNNQLLTGTQMGHQMGNDMINANYNLGQTAGNFESFMNPVTNLIGAGGQLVGAMAGMGGGYGGGNYLPQPGRMTGGRSDYYGATGPAPSDMFAR